MAKSGFGPKRRQERDLDLLFERANKHWDEGNLRSAFRLFLAGAKAGDTGSQVNLGNFYSAGTGVKRNRTLALYWYRRAYRNGERAAANNIGIVFRDEKKLKQALAWFERAVKLRDVDANLEIAKIYLQRNEGTKAIRYLKQVCKAEPREVTEASKEEARHLLSRLRVGKEEI